MRREWKCLVTFMNRMSESHLWKERIVILIYLYCFLILTLFLWLWLFSFVNFLILTLFPWLWLFSFVNDGRNNCPRIHTTLHVLLGLNAYHSWNVLNSRNHMSSHMDRTMDMEPLKIGKNHRMHQEMFVDPTLSVTTKDSWDGYEFSLSLSLFGLSASLSSLHHFIFFSLSLSLFHALLCSWLKWNQAASAFISPSFNILQLYLTWGVIVIRISLPFNLY